MSKDIEMFQISDKEPQIGTEIFDPTLPSNIDFEQPQSQHIEKVPFNPQKVSSMGKVLIIGEEMKSYRIVGKVLSHPQPLYFKGAIVKAHMHTFIAKVFDEEKSAGVRKFWETLVGYSKREISVTEGHLYFFQQRKEGLYLYLVMKLEQLFKIFIDPQEDKIRLIFKEGERLTNKDISPDKFLPFLEHLVHELSRIGLGVAE